jgi:hypothetical protein
VARGLKDRKRSLGHDGVTRIAGIRSRFSRKARLALASVICSIRGMMTQELMPARWQERPITHNIETFLSWRGLQQVV